MTQHRVIARNWATASSNRIHSDEVAAQYGFRGGLVPGVTTIAYLIPAVVGAHGDPWLSSGRLTVRLTTPVYDGEAVAVFAEPDGAVRMVGEAGDDDRVVASASGPPDPAPHPDRFRQGDVPAERPHASPKTLVPGTVLATCRHLSSRADEGAYLDAVNEAVRFDSIHPGWLLLDANEVLSSTVRLGPWIHVGSDMHVLRAVHDGEVLESRAVVTAEYERKGHRLVDLDVLTLADGEPALLVHHRAIYRLRRADAATAP